MKKMLLSLIFSSVLLIGISTETSTALANENAVTNNEEIDNSHIEQELSFSIEENESNVMVSDVMTFDEIVEEISESQDIPKKIAEDIVFTNSDIPKGRNARAVTYRTLSQQFTVDNTYKPTMRFYCQTDESGNFRAIKKILNIEMIRGYQGKSKQFNGNTYVKLEDANRIFYSVNGDFYNNGTTTYSSGVSIGIGKNSSVKFGVSNASNHYKYRYIESRIRF